MIALEETAINFNGELEHGSIGNSQNLHITAPSMILNICQVGSTEIEGKLLVLILYYFMAFSVFSIHYLKYLLAMIEFVNKYTYKANIPVYYIYLTLYNVNLPLLCTHVHSIPPQSYRKTILIKVFKSMFAAICVNSVSYCNFVTCLQDMNNMKTHSQYLPCTGDKEWIKKL